MTPRVYFLDLTDAELSASLKAAGKCGEQVKAGADANLWTPDGEPTERPERAIYESNARNACMGCDVMAECLELAMRLQEPHFIYGGLAPWEREHLTRLRNDGQVGATRLSEDDERAEVA